MSSPEKHVIAKRATNPATMRRSVFSFPNARTAFKGFLCGLGFSANDTILLPAYIGWSKNEGSGVFDPVQETGTQFAFYRMTRNLAIDLDDLTSKLTALHPRLVVFIHYFGFPDPSILQAIRVCREYDALILEDEAHALYTDWISGVSGRLGDAAIMSLHKMLPCRNGGLLLLNSSLDEVSIQELGRSTLQQPLECNPLIYDLWRIAEARRANALRLLELLPQLRGKIHPLFPALPFGVVPQTLPVIITDRSRDELYFELNEKGYGVVSLYHTLIAAIDSQVYPESHWLARRILNLPVHQDIQPHQLEAMIDCLAGLLRRAHDR